VLNASQQVGGALGLAVFSAIATARTGHLLARHTPPPEAMTSRFQRALLARSLCLAFAALFALRTTNTAARSWRIQRRRVIARAPGTSNASGTWSSSTTSPTTPATPRPGPLGPTRSPSHRWRTAKRVGSNGDPFGSNLVFVVEFP
jgi:hypothetical protein